MSVSPQFRQDPRRETDVVWAGKLAACPPRLCDPGFSGGRYLKLPCDEAALPAGVSAVSGFHCVGMTAACVPAP